MQNRFNNINRKNPKDLNKGKLPGLIKKWGNENKCYRCGWQGHFARDCKAPAPVNQQKTTYRPGQNPQPRTTIPQFNRYKQPFQQPTSMRNEHEYQSLEEYAKENPSSMAVASTDDMKIAMVAEGHAGPSKARTLFDTG